MKTLDVALVNHTYPIHIGQHLLAQPALYQPHLKGKQILIVSNATVAGLYAATVQAALSHYQTELLLLPEGEQYKTLDTVNLIFTRLLELRFDRSCTLIALGGGVIGDMVGYAAASYQRGVAFIQIPTTLLAQVDSSVGGKTGVNHPLGKNMIGAFYQPQLVLIDTHTLHSLPAREFAAGMAEVIKYGLLGDVDFLNWIEQHSTALHTLEQAAVAEAIYRSCAHKAAIVVRDEREAGERALLNLGHTFGHALETCLGYGTWLHGEAVALGMLMAAQLSQQLGRITPCEVERIRLLLQTYQLPTVAPAHLQTQALMQAMTVDKKNIAGNLRLILMEKLGQADIVTGIDPAQVTQLWADFGAKP